MYVIIVIELCDQFRHPAVLRLRHRVGVDMLKHPGPQSLHGLLHPRGHGNLRFVQTVQNNIVDQSVQPFPHAASQDVRVLPGEFLLLQQPGPDGVVNIVIDVGDLVGKADHPSFQRGRMAAGPVI